MEQTQPNHSVGFILMQKEKRSLPHDGEDHVSRTGRKNPTDMIDVCDVVISVDYFSNIFKILISIQQTVISILWYLVITIFQEELFTSMDASYKIVVEI